jgi:hypothetical protein
MNAYALVDYFNLPRRTQNNGLRSLAHGISDGIAEPGLEQIEVRLYGGWYDAGGLTKTGTLLAQEIDQTFPLSLRTPQGAARTFRCEIASSLIESRADLFFSTVRDRHGLAWYRRAAPPLGCVDPPTCTRDVVLRWSRNGCPAPGCAVTHQEAFCSGQQKLVDSLICCDLLSLCTGDPDLVVLLVSEDDDFIPALVLAGRRGQGVWQLRSKAGKDRLYDDLLLRSGVRLSILGDA